jgi:hypothetical protein
MARDRVASGCPLQNEKPRLHSKMQTGSFMLSPLARLLHLTEKRRSAGFVPATANFLGGISCGSTRHIPSGITRRSGKLLPVPPQRQNEVRPDPFNALAKVVS